MSKNYFTSVYVPGADKIFTEIWSVSYAFESLKDNLRLNSQRERKGVASACHSDGLKLLSHCVL